MKNSWNKLTLKDVEEIQDLQKYDNIIKSKAGIYSILSGKTMTEIEAMPSYDMLMDLSKLSEFMEVEPIAEQPTKFEIGQETFYPLLKFQDWLTWRMISYHNTIINNPTNIALQVALLTYKNKKEQIDASELERREQLIREQASYLQIYSMSVFFWILFNNYLKATVDYLKVKTKNQNQTISQIIGDGISHSIKQQVEREIYTPSET